MEKTLQGSNEGKGKHFAIVVSRFNEPVSKRLLEGALRAFSEAQVPSVSVVIAWVPGAFEIPTAAKKLALSKKFAGIVCLGAVIRGETPHFDYICTETARGIAQISLETGVPTLFGVLTCDNLEHAMARSGGKAGNKGAEAARGAIEMANLLQQMDQLQ